MEDFWASGGELVTFHVSFCLMWESQRLVEVNIGGIISTGYIYVLQRGCVMLYKLILCGADCGTWIWKSPPSSLVSLIWQNLCIYLCVNSPALWAAYLPCRWKPGRINATIPAFKLTSVFGCLLLCQPGSTERLFFFLQKDVLSCPGDSTENSQQPAQQLWMAQLYVLRWPECWGDYEETERFLKEQKISLECDSCSRCQRLTDANSVVILDDGEHKFHSNHLLSYSKSVPGAVFIIIIPLRCINLFVCK